MMAGVLKKLSRGYGAVLFGFSIGLTGLSSSVLAAQDACYLVLDRCPEADQRLVALKLNQSHPSPQCLGSTQAAVGADSATQESLEHLGLEHGTSLIRLESDGKDPARVREIFATITAPVVPLEQAVDRLRFYQAKVGACDPKATFGFTAVNDAGLFGLKTQRGWGEADIRVNTVHDLPDAWTLELVRYEILYEQALFRGIVERPTFDILHPRAERPLLVTVFDVMPRVRSSDNCPARKTMEGF